MALCSVQDMCHPNLPQVLHILDRLTVTKNDARINLKEKIDLRIRMIQLFLICHSQYGRDESKHRVIEKIWSDACPEHCRTSRISKP